MKKKLLIAGMSVIFSFKAMADVQPTITTEEIDKRNRAMLAKAGIELLDLSSKNRTPILCNHAKLIRGLKP